MDSESPERTRIPLFLLLVVIFFGFVWYTIVVQSRGLVATTSITQQDACIEYPIITLMITMMLSVILLAVLIQAARTKNAVEQTYRTLIEHSPQGVLILENWHVVFANAVVTAITGYRLDELRSKSPEFIQDCIYAEDRERVVRYIHASCMGHPPSPMCEYRLLHKDGTIRWVVAAFAPLHYQRKTALQGILLDTTEQKRLESLVSDTMLHQEPHTSVQQDDENTEPTDNPCDHEHMEEALHQSQELLYGIIEHSPALIYVKDTHWHTLLANQQCASFLDIEREKMVGATEDDLLPTDIVSVWRENDRKILALRKPITFEETFPQHDGILRTFLSTRFPLYTAQGDLYAIGSISTDITERKRAEEALHQSEARFASVFHSNPLPIIINRLFDGVVLDANQSFLTLAGYSRDEVVGQSANHVGFWTSHEQRQHIVQTLRKQNSIHGLNLPFYTRSGEERTIIAWMEMIEMNSSLYVVSTLNDITEQRRAEEALAMSEEKYRELVENISDVIYTLNTQGIMTYISPVVTQLAGYLPAEIIGHPFHVFIYEHDQSIVSHAYNQRKSGQYGSSEFRIVTRDGDVRWVRSTSKPFYQNGNLEGLQGMMSDITEQKHAQEAIKRRLDIESTLAEIAAFFMHTRDFDSAVSNALEAIGHLSNVNRSYLFLLRENGTVLENTHEWCDADMPSLLAAQRRIPIDQFLWEIEQLRANEFVELPDVSLLPPQHDQRKHLLVQRGIKAQLLFPIHANLELLGFIGLDNTRTAGTWPDEDIRVLQMVAHNIGGALFRTQVEAALEAQRSFLRQIIDSNPNLIFTKNQSGRYTLANRITADLYGTVVEEMIGKCDADYHTSVQDWQDHRRNDVAVLQTLKEKVVTEETFTTATGEVWWFHTIKRPIISTDGSQIEVLVVATDITERKRAEIALQASEERYRRLVDTSPDAIALVGLDGRLQLCNQSAARSLSFARSESLIGRSIFDFLDPEDHAHVRISLREIIQDGNKRNIQSTFLRPDDGARIPAEVSISLIYDTEGKPCGYIGVARDITERVRRERERESLFVVATALRTASSRAEMVPILLEQITVLLSTEGTALLLREVEHGDLVVEMGNGICARMMGTRVPAGEGFNEQVLSSGEPYLCNDVPNESGNQWFPLFANIQAVACVPLIAQEQIIGTLMVTSRGPMTEEEMRLLNAIGNMAANAIHRVTLHEQTEQRLRQMQALRTIDQAITSSFDVSLPLTILVDQALDHLKGDAASVLIFNPVTHELEYAAGRGFRSSMIRHLHVRFGDGCAGRVALERRFMHIPDITRAEENCVRGYLMQEEHLTAYYGVPLIARGQIKGVLELFSRVPFVPNQEWVDFFHALAGQAAIAIDNSELFAHLQSTNDELTLAYDATIEGWARALELRDVETEGHSRRVTSLTLKIADQMGFSDDELVHIRRGALLHDIGKMAIPDSILLKAGPLDSEELAIMRQHTIYAYQLLSPISFLRPALDIPYCHHEKWDGTGYPRGLKGESIPLSARIFSIVDVWDALTSDRPYRKAWSEEKVRAYIMEQNGSHFDPQITSIFLSGLYRR